MHLETWPETKKFDSKILESMKEVRKLASLGLEARMKAKINVRQPLARLSVESVLSTEFFDLVKDEVNIKEIVSDHTLAGQVALDLTITPELKEEGMIRELIRMIQDLRKERGLTIQDRAILTVDTDKALADLIEKNKSTISSATLLKDITYGKLEGEEMNVGEMKVKIEVGK